MGCDIHFYVEKTKGGEWVSPETWGYDEYTYTDGELNEDAVKEISYDKRYYSDRNYKLFAILADVRNGSGFAGCDTGDRLSPIADVRGLPDDVCGLIRDASDQMGVDGHSHSFYGLRELMTYDWTQVATLRGWITFPEYCEWRDSIRWSPGPSSYSGGVGGDKVKNVDVSEFEAELKKIDKDDTVVLQQRDLVVKNARPHQYTQVQWDVPYYIECSSFLSRTMPRLWKLADGDIDSVRIVFWFDN